MSRVSVSNSTDVSSVSEDLAKGSRDIRNVSPLSEASSGVRLQALNSSIYRQTIFFELGVDLKF
ncbi:hypothetical protein AAMO2058_000257800 [Amorphochlora amoebiformis]